MNAQQARPSRRRFTAAERERLTRLREAVQRGERSEALPVDRRQEFVRWLVAEGRLSEELRPHERADERSDAPRSRG